MASLNWSRAHRNPHGYEAAFPRERQYSKPAVRNGDRRDGWRLTPWRGVYVDKRCEEVIEMVRGVVVSHWVRGRGWLKRP